MVLAASAALRKLTANASHALPAAPSAMAIQNAALFFMRPATMGRSSVRVMSASTFTSHSWLNAAALAAQSAVPSMAWMSRSHSMCAAPIQ